MAIERVAEAARVRGVYSWEWSRPSPCRRLSASARQTSSAASSRTLGALTIALIDAAAVMSLAVPWITCGAGILPTLAAIAREAPGSLQSVGIVLAPAAVLAIT